MGSGKTIGVVAVVAILAVLALLFTGVFNVADRPPDCVFTEQNLTCEVPFSLEENRQAVTYLFNYNFSRVAASQSSAPVTVTSLHSVNTIDEGSRETDELRWFLYKAPAEWKEAAEITLETTVTGRARCGNGGDGVDMDLNNYVVLIPWGDQFIIGDDSQTDRNPKGYILEYDDDDGEKYTSTHNLQRINEVGVVDCSLSQSEEDRGELEDFTKSATLTSVIPEASIQKDITKQRFVVEVEIGEDNEGGSGSIVSGPTVKLSYKEAKYPTDLKYSVGGIFIETLAGEQKTGRVSLDIADQVNKACNRQKNGDACTFTLKLESSQPGLLWVDSTSTLKLWEEVPDPDPEPDPDPGDDEPSTGFFANVKAFFAKIWDWIVGVFS